MLKKLLTIMMAFMVLFTMPLAAFAVEEDSETTDDVVVEETLANEAEEEVEVEVEEVVDEQEEQIISTKEGAEVRLAQLERAVEAHIEGANTIIAELEADNASVDFDSLYAIVEKFEALLITIEEVDLTQENEVLASTFVSLKSDAIALTKEFREEVKDELSEERKAEIREKYQARKAEIKEKYQERIDELRKKFNGKAAARLAEKLGFDSQEIRAQVEAGELTREEVRVQVKEAFEALSDEEKEALKQELAEERKKNRVEAKEKLEERRTQVNERNQERREDLRAKFDERRDEIKERFENRKDEFHQKARNLNDSRLNEAREFVRNNPDQVREFLENNPEAQKRLEEIRANGGRLPKDLEGLDVNSIVENSNVEGGNE